MTFYFAWAASTETAFNPATHLREDEDVFALTVEHEEGNFAKLTIDLVNPRRSLLTPENDIWLWLAKDNTPAFFGRLVAVPENISQEIARLTFIARPEDYEILKQALADQLRVAPYWDAIWIRDELLNDPDVVLEARAELYHIDRITHNVTTSSILDGEDGSIEFGPDNFFYDSLSMTYRSPPLNKVYVEAEISWEQRGIGELDITNELVAAFHAAGSTRPNLISSYTGQGLEADWPEPETDLKSGWYVAQSNLDRADGVWFPAHHFDVAVASLTPVNDDEGEAAEAFFSTPYTARFYLWEFKPTFVLGYDVSRQYIERVFLDIDADVQPVFSDGDNSDTITLSSRKVSDPIIEGGIPPIGDLSRNSYIRTDRGRRSVEYLIALARAKLLHRARVVEISITIPFDDGLQLSCRKNVIITDDRIPTGQAAGKIIRYILRADGEGRQEAELTIGCTVGYGNTVDASAGAPTYAEDGYVAVGYQYRTAENYAPIAGEVTYTDYSDTPINDDGLSFQQMRSSDVLINFEVINGVTRQLEVIQTSDDPSGIFRDIPAAIEALNAVHTEVWLELKPLAIEEPFETEFQINVSRLMVPQMVVV